MTTGSEPRLQWSVAEEGSEAAGEDQLGLRVRVIYCRGMVSTRPSVGAVLSFCIMEVLNIEKFSLRMHEVKEMDR